MGPSKEWGLPDCPGCGAAGGGAHGEDCIHAHCPDCGQHLLDRCGHDVDRPALWHGVDPVTEVAQEEGWWRPDGGVWGAEDIERAKEAVRRGYVAWDPNAQRYRRASEITAVELPTALLREALRAGTEGRRGEVAAVTMLAEGGGWLDRQDFRLHCVDYERAEVGGEGPGVAHVQWEEAAAALADGRLAADGADTAVLLLAASMGAGVPVDLRRALIEVRRSRRAGEIGRALAAASE